MHTHTSLYYALALVLPVSAWAADNPAAHQHGYGELSLAIDGSRVELLLETPAYNLIGFEHEPRTETERHRLAHIREWLQTTPLLDTIPPGCTLSAAQVYQHHSHHNGDHDHDGEEHDHDAGAHSQHHSAFEVTQTLECPALTHSRRLTTPLLTDTEHMEALSVRWAGSQGQGGVHLRAGQKQFSLEP